MKEVTRGQQAEVVSRILTQTVWDKVDGNILQERVIKLSPAEFGDRFTRFLQNGCQFVFGSPPVLHLGTTAFNPTEFISEHWKVWRGSANGKGLEGAEEIYEPVDLTELNAQDMLFEHFLTDKDGSSIRGETKLDRAKDSKNILLGGRSFLTMWRDWQTNKENSFLEWLRKNCGITWMDFPGLVLRSSSGGRYILYFYFDGSEWGWSYHYLGGRWGQSGPSALLASIKKVLGA